MISYEVTVDIDPAIVGAYRAYMADRHIPDLIATGCFVGAEFAQAGPGRFRQRYVAATQADLDRYLTGHAARMREDFAGHFPSGVAVTRATWEVLRSWG